MDDPATETASNDERRVRQVLDGGRLRWHAVPGDRLLYVLDDGTGDVELRVRRNCGVLQGSLTRLDVEFHHFDVPDRDDAAGINEMLTRIDTAVAEDRTGTPGEPAKSKTRFIASFEADQLARLRAVAEQEQVPVAEVVRRAVAAYLDRVGAPPRAGS